MEKDHLCQILTENITKRVEVKVKRVSAGINDPFYPNDKKFNLSVRYNNFRHIDAKHQNSYIYEANIIELEE